MENKLGNRSLRVEDVKPGLHREAFTENANVMLIVAGSGSGNTQVYYTTSGSSAGMSEGIKTSVPWMIKPIHGAALTKYGK